MKTSLILLLAAASVTAAYLTGHSQQPRPAQVLRSTKVGAVNLGLIYPKSERVKQFKAGLEREFAHLLEKKKNLEGTIREWTPIRITTDDNFSPQTREMAGWIVKTAERELSDLDYEARHAIARKTDKMIAELQGDLQKAVETYAADHGYHLIVMYGEPETPLPTPKELQRRMGVVDRGGLSPIHVSNEIDISLDLLKILDS